MHHVCVKGKTQNLFGEELIMVMLASTTDRYGHTVHVGTYVTARSLEFDVCDLWRVSKVHIDGKVDLMQRNGISYSQIDPDEIIQEI
jgi:hypothetical protein